MKRILYTITLIAVSAVLVIDYTEVREKMSAELMLHESQRTGMDIYRHAMREQVLAERTRQINAQYQSAKNQPVVLTFVDDELGRAVVVFHAVSPNHLVTSNLWVESLFKPEVERGDKKFGTWIIRFPVEKKKVGR